MTAPATAAEARLLLEREISTVQALVASLARRYGLDGDEEASFGSWVMERLLDDDGAVLRKFQGRSSLRTYLTVVVANLFRDYRNKTLGRWRPSAAAQRLGPAAVLLDAALNRAGHPLDEAVRLVASRSDVAEDEATLRRFAREIPRREPRRHVPEEAAQGVGGGPRADEPLAEAEQEDARRRAGEALERALAALPDQDQVIVRLHFWEGLTLAAVARTLRIEQKPLYRRLEANLRHLRGALEEAGISVADVREVLP